MTAHVTAQQSATATGRVLDASQLDGTYAGVISRSVAYLIDATIVSVTFSFGGAALEYLFSRVLNVELDLADKPLVSGILFAVWAFVYFAYPLATGGRTLGKAIIGLRVVRSDGGDVGAWRAVARVLAMVLSLALLPISVALIVIRKDRRTLHDLIAGTAEVYAWRARPASHAPDDLRE